MSPVLIQNWLRAVPHVCVTAVLFCVVACVVTARASADEPFGIAVGSGSYTASAAGDPLVQAGSHPDSANVFLEFDSTTKETPFGPLEYPNGEFKDILTAVPQGVVGSPLAAPTCPRDVFAEAKVSTPSKCPDNAAVGWARLQVNYLPYQLYGPVFNLEPDYGEPALFGFRISSATIYLHTSLRTGPEPTIMIDSYESSQALPIVWAEVTLWGVPGASSHNKQRGFCMQQSGPTGKSCPSTAELKPMISAPTSCDRPLESTVRANSWEQPESWSEVTFANELSSGEPALLTGCERLPFEPKLQAQMEPKAAASPGSLDVNLSIPQREGANELVSSHLRNAVVTLPQGVSLNSSAADGLQACSVAQVGLNESAPSRCPAASKVADLTVSTPLLAQDLNGSIYLAKQNENPFGSMYAVYLVIDDPSMGIYVKVPGRVDVDPNTGQITTSFSENPQVPFDRLSISFAGGPRSPLRLPETCGTYMTKYTLTSWSGRTVEGSDAITVDQNCGKQGLFAPSFSAGTANPVGGSFSAFNLRLTREDGQQNLSSIDLRMPQGLTAKLAGVPLCGDTEAVTGACPAASQIGTTTVAAGVGTNPVYVPQPGREPTALYLSGPYKGAPYSLVAKVPAQAGPFDLGTVVVRNAIYVDPTTVQVSVKSDPLPQILQGVPVSYRDVRVEVNRPEFILNPTSCEPMAVTGAIGSSAGAVANVSSRFQVSDCAGLRFAPKLKLSLSGQTKKSGNPALKAVLTQPQGSNANIGRVQVILPKTAFIDNAHVNNPCTRAQYAAGACPKNSILGTATAYSPLLDRPLTGKVYFRANGGERDLPDLVAALRGQIDVDLVGFIDSVQRKGTEISRVRSTFDLVPDAPVSRFVMNLKGGKVGLIENSANLCRVKRNRATVKMDGQNGKVHDTQPVVASSCGKNAGKAKK